MRQEVLQPWSKLEMCVAETNVDCGAKGCWRQSDCKRKEELIRQVPRFDAVSFQDIMEQMTHCSFASVSTKAVSGTLRKNSSSAAYSWMSKLVTILLPCLAPLLIAALS